jgi:4'-phosphopantetheinyl transferase
MDPVAVWVLDVAAARVRLDGWLGVLDEGERRRYAAFVREEDRIRYGVAHAGLRRLLGERMGIAPGDVRLTNRPCVHCGGPHGKPEVVDGPQWSMTHSGDLAVYALAPWPARHGPAVGVDVERVDRAVDPAGLSAYLHPRERAELAALPPDEVRAAFFRCWTRKEAYLKGTGAGLNDSLSRWYVGTAESTVDTPEGWSLASVPVPEGYVAALAVAHVPPLAFTVSELDLDEQQPDYPKPAPAR